MRLLPFSPVQGLLCLAALALTACAPLAPSSGRPSPEVLQTLNSSALPDKPSAQQSQQWLDRVTWGATDHDAARLQQQGLKRWLAAQLSPSSAPMPTEVQQHIDALGISQKPMTQIQREIADQRLAIRNSQDPEEAAKLRSELQRQLNQLGGEAQKRHIWRALYSPHQLQEQMTWFWMNHFNVSTRKGDVRMWVGDYEEQAIRPHALGKFRELLELHTMGVGSGYTQADVQAMAHVLTGVGFSTREADAPPPRLRPERQGDYLRHGFFEFNPNRHDYTPQVLLGRPLEKSGLAQVNEAVDRIVASPVTARFIARKLCVYFLGDKPPQAVVERTAQAFERSHGDIAATLAALLSDPQAQQFGQGFKDPVHYVLGATRLAYDQRVASDVSPVQNWLNQLGQPLYGHETPDGYPVTQSDWSSSGQMNARFEVARQIGSRGGLLFRSSAQQPLEKPPYPDLDKRSSVQARVPALGAATRAALAQTRNPADWNSFFLSAPEMMYR